MPISLCTMMEAEVDLSDNPGPYSVGLSGGNQLSSNIKASILFMTKLNEMRQNRQFCDLVFEVGDAIFYAHRLVVSMWSPLLIKMLSVFSTRTERIRVLYNKHSVFHQFLSFLYTGLLECTSDIPEVLRLASSFQIQWMSVTCEELLEKSINVENVIGIFQTAVTYKLKDLECHCVEYLKQHLPEVAQNSELRELTPEQMNAFLESHHISKLNPELKLFLIISWLTEDVWSRQRYLILLLACIDWSVVASDFLTEISQTENFFTSNPSSLYLLLQTLRSADIPLGPYTDQFESLREQHHDLLDSVVSSIDRLGTQLYLGCQFKSVTMFLIQDKTGPVASGASVSQPQKVKSRKLSVTAKKIKELGICSFPSVTSQKQNDKIHSAGESDSECLFGQQQEPEGSAKMCSNHNDRIDVIPSSIHSDSVDQAVADEVEVATCKTGTNTEILLSQRSRKTNKAASRLKNKVECIINPKEVCVKSQKIKNEAPKIEISVEEDMSKSCLPKRQRRQSSRVRKNTNLTSRQKSQRKNQNPGTFFLSPENKSEKYGLALSKRKVRSDSQEEDCCSDENILADFEDDDNKSVLNIQKQDFDLVRDSEKKKKTVRVAGNVGSQKRKKEAGRSQNKGRRKKNKKNSDSTDIPMCKSVRDSEMEETDSKQYKVSGFPSGRLRKEARNSLKLKCPDCDFACLTQRQLQQHSRKVHKSSSLFRCNLCEFSCRWNKEYYMHLQTAHFPGPPFQCDSGHCSFTATKLRVLMTHRLKHSDDRPFVCEICNSAFRTQNNLYGHQKIHIEEKKFECPECKKCFKLKNTLNQHMVTHSDLRPYLCDTCGFSTKFQSHLTAHKRSHTGDMYKCSFPSCTFLTSKRCMLKGHMRTHLDLRPHVCTTCGKAFVERSHMVRHERIHLAHKSYECDHCEFASVRKDKLKEHVHRYHNPEYKHVNCKNRARYNPREVPGRKAGESLKAAYDATTSQGSLKACTVLKDDQMNTSETDLTVTDTRCIPVRVECSASSGMLHVWQAGTGQASELETKTMDSDGSHASGNQLEQAVTLPPPAGCSTVSTQRSSSHPCPPGRIHLTSQMGGQQHCDLPSVYSEERSGTIVSQSLCSHVGASLLSTSSVMQPSYHVALQTVETPASSCLAISRAHHSWTPTKTDSHQPHPLIMVANLNSSHEFQQQMLLDTTQTSQHHHLQEQPNVMLHLQQQQQQQGQSNSDHYSVLDEYSYC